MTYAAVKKVQRALIDRNDDSEGSAAMHTVTDKQVAPPVPDTPRGLLVSPGEDRPREK